MSYDWQADRRDSFRSWMIPSVISEMGGDKAFMERLSDATDKFTNVEFGITINGIAVDADSFIDGVSRNMRHFANDRAAELVRENIALSELNEILHNITLAADHAVREAVKDTPLADYLDREQY